MTSRGRFFCGNVYFGSVTLFDTDGSLYICPYDFHAGRSYRVSGGHLFGGGKVAPSLGRLGNQLHAGHGPLQSTLRAVPIADA